MQIASVDTHETPSFGTFQTKTKQESLEEMFGRMEIKVQGKENEEEKSEHSMDESEDDDDLDAVNQSMYVDDNKISQKHQKYTDLESRA